MDLYVILFKHDMRWQMEEKVKKLKPTVEVLRELYLKSGNQCAFPGCYNATSCIVS